MTVSGVDRVIEGDQAVAEFRHGLTGAEGIRLLDEAGGRLIVQLPVGAGKSTFLRAVLEHALTSARPEALVVVLAPRWDILLELRRRISRRLRPVLLQPRPRSRCGALDGPWSEYESRGCGLLGREQLCPQCPHRATCAWTRYHANGLRGRRLVLCTQQHLAQDAEFVARLKARTGATRSLLLLDESDLLLRPFRRELPANHFALFAAVVAQVAAVPAFAQCSQRWAVYLQILSGAATADLAEGAWQPPPADPAWALAVQEIGRKVRGNEFYYVAHDLNAFSRSDPRSRERTPDGTIRYSVMPDLGEEAIIFSGSIAPVLARHRLDPDRVRPAPASPFAGIRFKHPQTHWYNLANAAGAATHFPRNSNWILDMFAQLIARNIAVGKRTLLVARKQFRKLIQRDLTQRLTALVGSPVCVVTGNWARQPLSDLRTVPLISYGVSGINRFENYDAAYCLTSYYVSPVTVQSLVNELEVSDHHVAVRVELGGRPRRRQAVVDDPRAAGTIVPVLAEAALLQKEGDVVVQAVGRVRPFTRPREVITMQMGALPGVGPVDEFATLAAVRTHFGLATPSEARMRSRMAEVARLKALGWTVAQIAVELRISERTVKRALRAARGHIVF